MSGDGAKMLPVTFQRNLNRSQTRYYRSPSEIETLSAISSSICAFRSICNEGTVSLRSSTNRLVPEKVEPTT